MPIRETSETSQRFRGSKCYKNDTLEDSTVQCAEVQHTVCKPSLSPDTQKILPSCWISCCALAFCAAMVGHWEESLLTC